MFLELCKIKFNFQAVRDADNSSFFHKMNYIKMQTSFCARVLLPFPGFQISLIPTDARFR